jgi:GxxExxY protein
MNDPVDEYAHWPHRDLTQQIIGACIEVHRTLGPGLLESAYRTCVAFELQLRGLRVQRELGVTVEYKGLQIENAYRIDLVVDEKVILEAKSVLHLTPVHDAQLLTYLRLAHKQVGLLVNFNARSIRSGLRRLIV